MRPDPNSDEALSWMAARSLSGSFGGSNRASVRCGEKGRCSRGIPSFSIACSLAAAIEQAMEKLGIPREQRPFSPHLTLARFEPPKLPERLRAAIHDSASSEFGSGRIDPFHLL